MRDYIELKSKKNPTFLGLASSERNAYQWIDLDFKMYYDSKFAAGTGKLSDCVDYVRVLGETKFILWVGRFFLIETALESIAQYILQTTVASRVMIQAYKPEALDLNSIPSLCIERDIQDYPKTSAGECEIKNTDVHLLRKKIDSRLLQSLTHLYSAVFAIENGIVAGQKPLFRGHSILLDPSSTLSAAESSDALLLRSFDKDFDVKAMSQYPMLDGRQALEQHPFYEAVLGQYVKRS